MIKAEPGHVLDHSDCFRSEHATPVDSLRGKLCSDEGATKMESSVSFIRLSLLRYMPGTTIAHPT